MEDISQDIESLHDPRNIREALCASGPSVLWGVFEDDPTVKRLLRAGSKAVPLIAAELEKRGLDLHPITASCFAYILQKTDAALAGRILGPLFLRALKRPDPFFMYFAAHALRQDMKLPFRPGDPEYTFGQLQETAAWVERRQSK